MLLEPLRTGPHAHVVSLLEAARHLGPATTGALACCSRRHAGFALGLCAFTFAWFSFHLVPPRADPCLLGQGPNSKKARENYRSQVLRWLTGGSRVGRGREMFNAELLCAGSTAATAGGR